jgi:hypothetical protein
VAGGFCLPEGFPARITHFGCELTELTKPQKSHSTTRSITGDTTGSTILNFITTHIIIQQHFVSSPIFGFSSSTEWADSAHPGLYIHKKFKMLLTKARLSGINKLALSGDEC